MDSLFAISFDSLSVSFLACCAIRQLMIYTLPDEVAGPGGWFIDTGEEA
ncbi:MAG: hypothetical protein ACC631_11395 [Halocynthiibacter sp.]